MSRSDEEVQKAAEHKAASLHNLGPEAGAGATVWARAVSDLLDLHESARQVYAEGKARLDTWERLHATALMLVVAIDQVLAFERRVRRLTGDAELARAREAFDARCPDTSDLRDLVAHLDAYAAGDGWRQTGQGLPPIDDQHLATFISWSDGGGTRIDLGDHQMNLRTAASAASDLASVVERVRAKHLELTEKEANAAPRRRYGMPPE